MIMETIDMKQIQDENKILKEKNSRLLKET